MSFFSISIFAVLPLKSNRAASSLRAWLMALSISPLSISDTMSKDGMARIMNPIRANASKIYLSSRLIEIV